MAAIRTIELLPDVVLAELLPRHAKTMYEWVRSPDVSDNIGLTKEPTLEKTVSWIEEARRSDTIAPFAIHSAGVYVGNVVFDQIDRDSRVARFSIYIGEALARGRGIGTTATILALREGFGRLALRVIWLSVHARNVSAIRVYERLGFSVSDVRPGKFTFRGDQVDEIVMRINSKQFGIVEENCRS